MAATAWRQWASAASGRLAGLGLLALLLCGLLPLNSPTAPALQQWATTSHAPTARGLAAPRPSGRGPVARLAQLTPAGPSGPRRPLPTVSVLGPLPTAPVAATGPQLVFVVLFVAVGAGTAAGGLAVAAPLRRRLPLLRAAEADPPASDDSTTRLASQGRRVLDPEDRIQLREMDRRPGFRLTPNPLPAEPVPEKPSTAPLQPLPEPPAGWREERWVPPPPPVPQESVMEEEDLNGVQPGWLFAGSFLAIVCAAVCWNVLHFLFEYYTLHPTDPELVYPAQRLIGFLKNVSVGLFALNSGIFFFTSIGMGLLGVRVTYGVLTGELDPNKPRAPPPSSPEEVGPDA